MNVYPALEVSNVSTTQMDWSRNSTHGSVTEAIAEEKVNFLETFASVVIWKLSNLSSFRP